MSKKVLFIGFEDCEESILAFNFLNLCGFETTPVWAKQKRFSKLPLHVKEWSGDYLLHFRSYCILKKRLLDRVSIAAINFHPCSPKYPGAGGINWGLYNEDEHSGVTVHYMNEAVDNGKILKTYKVQIYPNDTVESLLSRVNLQQLNAFYDFAGNLSKHGEKFLQNQLTLSKHEAWGKHVGRMREIDNLETIDREINKEELERIIRATKIGNFGPKIKIHGYTFQLKG
jgi:methionyl-tRNA formyltransferase